MPALEELTESPGQPLPPSAQLTRSRVLRALFGALLGLIPVIVSYLMRPNHRSPYLLAYPAVVLSAWLWGLPGAVACACVPGVIVEHFLFGTRQVDLTPTSNGRVFREAVFLLGSILAGTLTRFAARKQRQHATAALERQLQLAEAQAEALAERNRANELARENEVRIGLALDGANAGLWEWDIQSNKSTWGRPGFIVCMVYLREAPQRLPYGTSAYIQQI